MEKKNEYTDKLLQNLQSLQARVSAIKQEDSVPFSFFRDAFQKGQEIMRLLHEMEMLQIEDMKRQMEKLVLFLSENESQKAADEAKPVELEEKAIVPEISEPKPEVETEESLFPDEAEKIAEDEKIVRKNTYAEGIILPTYTNPRSLEPKHEEVAEVVPPPVPAETEEVKPVIRSVNDIVKAPPAKLEVKRGLSLNDRFYYQRELFDNNREAMNSMMIRLNAFDNYEDTERYLRENTSWDFKDERVKGFLELLKKGFE